MKTSRSVLEPVTFYVKELTNEPQKLHFDFTLTSLGINVEASMVIKVFSITVTTALGPDCGLH